MNLITSFFSISFLMLLYNTIKDLRTSYIDERFNYTVYGAIYMLIPYLNISFLKIIILIFVASIVTMSAKKLLASGDIAPINWIILGLGIISYKKLIFWLILFTFYTIIYVYLLHKYNVKKAPFYHIFLVSYFITILL